MTNSTNSIPQITISAEVVNNKMGKKSRKGGGGKQAAKENAASTEGASQTQALPKAAKRDVTELVNQLLDSKSQMN